MQMPFDLRIDDAPSLRKLLGDENERLRSLLRRCRDELSAGRSEAARSAFAELASQLERQPVGQTQPATVGLWMEHGELRRLLQEARQRTARGGEVPPGMLDALDALLLAHRVREEVVLDSVLGRLDDPVAVDGLLHCLELCLSW